MKIAMERNITVKILLLGISILTLILTSTKSFTIGLNNQKIIKPNKYLDTIPKMVRTSDGIKLKIFRDSINKSKMDSIIKISAMKTIEIMIKRGYFGDKN
jgi:hypothetical protein